MNKTWLASDTTTPARNARKLISENKVMTSERFNRTAMAVTGQILKILSVKPDAVLVGGAGTDGAFNTSPSDRLGLDQRSRVVIAVRNGAWQLVR